MALTGKQRRALRALGHHLEPVVLIGREGLGGGVQGAVEQALEDHELIKVKVGEGSPMDRHEVAEALAEATGSEVAQVLGRTLLLFRRHPENPKIEVPGMPLPPKPKAAPAAKKAAPAKARRVRQAPRKR